MEARIVKHRFGGHEVRLHKTWMPNEKGDLALRFACHFGVIAAKHGGEDSKGRAQIILQSPKEVVKRACKMAELIVEEFKKRDWIVDLPDLPEEEEEPTKPAKPEGDPPAIPTE